MARRVVSLEWSRIVSNTCETQVRKSLFVLDTLFEQSLQGLEEEGLFRRSPNTVMLNQARDAYDRGKCQS
jgi:hypothetical protein